MAELPVEIGQVADQLRLALLGRLFREPGINQGVCLVACDYFGLNFRKTIRTSGIVKNYKNSFTACSCHARYSAAENSAASSFL